MTKRVEREREREKARDGDEIEERVSYMLPKV